MEINGNPFAAQLRWGLTAGPMTYDPPVTDSVAVSAGGSHCAARFAASGACRPTSCRPSPRASGRTCAGIPIGWLTSEFGGGGSPVANVAFLKQVGCTAEMLRLRDYGICRQRQPDAAGEEQPRSVRRDPRLADSGRVSAPPAEATLRESSKRLLPWLVAVAFFMESLDTTILNTAVPDHRRGAACCRRSA